MEALRYIFWVFCLVQIITVNGKPDFATSFQFSSTTSISRLSNDISTLFASMDDELHFMLSGSIPDSETQRQLLAGFSEDFGVRGRAVTDQLAASASSMSSMGTTLGMVLTAYNQLVVYFNSNANNFLGLTNIEVGSYAAREFYNGLVRLVTSLPAVRVAVQMLQASLQTATTEEDVSRDVLRSLIRALQQLKAHLPLLVYTFQRIGVNIQTADIYMVLFNQDLQTLSSDFMDEVVAFNGQLAAFETAVGITFVSVEEMFDNAGTQLDTELTGDVESQTNFMQLQTELKTFTSDRSMFLQGMGEAMLPVSTNYQQSLEYAVTNTYYVDGSYTLDFLALELVMQLITSGVYDRLCYNKYAALVADLPSLGRIRLNECFHTELPRLRKLQKLIQTYTLMVSYDVEDLLLNLKPCRSEYAASDCLSVIAAFYTQLYAARASDSAARTENFFTSALSASLNRVGLCFTRTNFFTFQNLVPSLEQGMRSCPRLS
uniref:Secreted protein n=1 Tax=Anopheles funestus TaxID=62324 RepID=A0A182RTX3_ANOFN